jgi:hypothetical protein
MFFQSKLFRVLLPLAAYLFFAFLWIYNYKFVWYANMPDETQYFRKPNMGFYMMYAYLFFISFSIFLIFGIIYLVRNPVPKFIIYILAVNLIFSAYYVWHYSTILKTWGSNGNFLFLILALFAFSISKLTRPKQSE